ncbi:HAMP domain-containing sensor histidine kinase [Sphaerothrix gracilis]|uniref:sensor histidine kinase n=1 Tax=Sphaerothrix gracilis TaxID=3151835 RepID=UPI0031FBB92E
MQSQVKNNLLSPLRVVKQDRQPTDFVSSCQQLIDQLFDQLSVTAIWGVFRAGPTSRYQAVARYWQGECCFNSAMLTYLESEDWLCPDFVPLQVERLDLAVGDLIPYFCGDNPDAPYYLLIWSKQPLSQLQQFCIAQQTRLMGLTLCPKSPPLQSPQLNLLQEILQRIEHQLRNPLALVGLYADLLRQNLSQPKQQQQAQQISDTITDIGNSLKQIRQYSRTAQLQLQAQDVRQLLEDSLRGLHPWIEQKGLQVVYPTAALVIEMDTWQMKQVFHNLLSNAIYFSPPQSTITCRWTDFQQEILIEICDQGAGLSDIDMKEIFKPFYSRRSGGTGLGLAIAQQIVQQHQGRIWADNLPQRGAQFCISLPRLA